MIPTRTAGDNVIPFPRLDAGIQVSRHSTPFDRLTAALIVDQHRRGVLPEAIVVALLAGAGLQP